MSLQPQNLETASAIERRSKKIGLFLVIVLVLLLTCALVACSAKKGSDGNELEIPDYVKPTLSATYGQTLADITLPEGFTWQAPLTTSVGNAGNNEFLVTFTPSDTEKYQTITDIPVIIQVAKATYDMTGIVLNGGQFTYDGSAKSLAITGTLPDGVTVSYDNNGKVDAGTYEVVAHFTGNSNYNDIPDLRANLVIIKADLTGLSFVDSTVTYNGQAQSITVTGLGEGMSVVYSMQNVATGANIQTNVGTYAITATVSKANFNSVTLNATLTINKGNITGLSFVNTQVTYDGTVKSLLVTGTLPDGVEVAYTGNTGTDAGTYNATATFTVTNPNYNALDAMHATLTITKAFPQYADLVPNLITIDIDDSHYFFGPYYVESGFEPRLYQTDPGHAEYASPLFGKNIIYANYNLGSNYEVIEDIPFTVLGWDSDVYTVATTYNTNNYLSMVYDAENNVTLRLVGPSNPEIWASFCEMVDHDEIFVYAYSGQYTSDAQLVDNNNNPIAPIAVYSIYQNDGLFNVGERIYDWNGNNYHGENEDDYIPKYVLDININTLVPSFFDAGEVTYIYRSEPDNETLAFYTFEVENGPDDHYLFIYDGLYNDNTLPKAGTFIGTWDYEVDPYISASHFDYLFYTDSQNNIHINTGDELYRFGYWDDKNFDDEYYVVLSFCDDENFKHIFMYFFDEEVDITDENILNGKTPSLFCYTGWELIKEASVPVGIDCEYFIFDSFDIGTDGVVTAHLTNRDWFWEGLDGSGNEMSIYFRAEDNKAYNFHNAHSLGEAQFYWENNQSNLTNYYLFQDSNIHWEEDGPFIDLYSPHLDSSFCFRKTTRNGGELTHNLGEICWVVEQGYDNYSNLNRYMALTRLGNGYTGTEYFFAESAEQVLTGRVEAIFDRELESYPWVEKTDMVHINIEGNQWKYDKNDDHTLTIHMGEIVGIMKGEEIDTDLYLWYVLTIDNGETETFLYEASTLEELMNGLESPYEIVSYISWKLENGYIIMPGPGIKAVYTIDENKMISMFIGDVVEEFIEYEYVDEQDHTIVSAVRFTANDVLGNHLGFAYNAIVENGAIVKWVLDENDMYKWTYNNLGDFYSFEIFKYGDWNCYKTYFAVEVAPNEKEYEIADYPVVSYGYLYKSYEESLNEIKYETWIVTLYLIDDPIAQVVIFKGKIAKKDILTYAELNSINFEDASARETAGITSVLSTLDSECEWRYSDLYFLGIEFYGYSLTIDPSGENMGIDLFPTDDGSFAVYPSIFEETYCFVEEGDSYSITSIYLRNIEDESKNVYGWTFENSSYLMDECAHVIGLSWDECYWTEIKKGNETYLAYSENGYITGAAHVTQNGLEYENTVVYVIEDEGYTFVFCDEYGIANPILRIEGTNLTEEQINEGLIDGPLFVGVWAKDGNYVLWIDSNHIYNGDDSDDVLYELKDGELCEPTDDYYGAVLDSIVIEPDGDPYTIVLVDWFGESQFYIASGEKTLEQITVLFNSGSCNLCETIKLTDNLYIVATGYLFDISSGKIALAEIEIIYWVDDGGLIVFAQVGDGKFVFEIVDENDHSITTRPSSPDEIEFAYVTDCYGTWAEDTTGEYDIINYNYGTKTPFYIIDEETGEINFAVMP